MRTKGKWEVEIEHDVRVGEIFNIISRDASKTMKVVNLAYNVTDEEDAEYICKAVNNHDKLVEFLRFFRMLDENAAKDRFNEKVALNILKELIPNAKNLLKELEGFPQVLLL